VFCQVGRRSCRLGRFAQRLPPLLNLSICNESVFDLLEGTQDNGLVLDQSLLLKGRLELDVLKNRAALEDCPGDPRSAHERQRRGRIVQGEKFQTDGTAQ